jgi:hypothetical protein
LFKLAEALPEEVRKQLPELPPEVKGALEAMGDTPDVPPPAPLLEALTYAGLLHKEGDACGCHELVRERVAAWMADNPEERGGLSEQAVWTAYAERHETAFHALLQSGERGARERAVQAGRLALEPYLRAGALERLSGFASKLVTSTNDPRLLGAIAGSCSAVADEAPASELRWKLRTYLADALNRSGHPDQALPLYGQAAAEAQAAEHWSDVVWITGNQALALKNVGQLKESREAHGRSAEAERKAGRPEVNVVGSELEALRVAVMQGEAEEALPQIEERLGRVRGWWQRSLAGEEVPEAPDRESLAWALRSGLEGVGRPIQAMSLRRCARISSPSTASCPHAGRAQAGIDMPIRITIV